MKPLMVICAGEQLADVQRIIDAHEVSGYTEVPNVPGSGATGRPEPVEGATTSPPAASDPLPAGER